MQICLSSICTQEIAIKYATLFWLENIMKEPGKMFFIYFKWKLLEVTDWFTHVIFRTLIGGLGDTSASVYSILPKKVNI